MSKVKHCKRKHVNENGEGNVEGEKRNKETKRRNRMERQKKEEVEKEEKTMDIKEEE